MAKYQVTLALCETKPLGLVLAHDERNDHTAFGVSKLTRSGPLNETIPWSNGIAEWHRYLATLVLVLLVGFDNLGDAPDRHLGDSPNRCLNSA